MLILASKSTIMMLVTIIVVGICVVVIAAASISCGSAKRNERYYNYVEREPKEGNHTKK